MPEPVLPPLQPVKQHAFLKPFGLWLSPATEDGWLAYCQHGDFLSRIHYAVEITLKPRARILRITDRAGIERLTEKHGGSPFTFAKMPALEAIRGGTMPAETLAWLDQLDAIMPDEVVMSIDWPTLSKRYDGVLIAPFVYECSRNHRAGWYYAWDCASGCVWHPRAIATLGEPIALRSSPNRRCTPDPACRAPDRDRAAP